MTKMTKVAIVGCGRLGLPLALTLQKNGLHIVATSRSEQKVESLSEIGLTALQYSLGDDLNKPDLAPLFDCDVLVLNIPVGRKSAAPEAFVKNIQALIQRARQSSIKHLLFISTTSVYGDSEQVVTETSPANPLTASAKVNYQIEQEVQACFSEQASVLRLAGLIGEGRHPAKFLSGKRDLSNPDQVVNLIHQDDVIQCICRILQQQIWGHVLLLCAPQHPSRKHYYTWAAENMGLVAPHFKQQQQGATGKRVDASFTLAKLGLNLAYPSPFDMC